MIKRCLFRLVFSKFVPFDRAVFDPLSIHYRSVIGAISGVILVPFLIFALQLRYKVTHKIANLQVFFFFCNFFSIFLAYFKKKLYLCTRFVL